MADSLLSFFALIDDEGEHGYGQDDTCSNQGPASLLEGVNDPVYFLNFMFGGGPPMGPPFPDCGASASPTDLNLGCESPIGCW